MPNKWIALMVSCDQLVLNKFESFAHWLEEWTGEDNFSLAYVTFFITAGLCLLVALLSIWHQFWLLFLVDLFFTSCLSMTYKLIKMVSAVIRPYPDHLNPLKDPDWPGNDTGFRFFFSVSAVCMVGLLSLLWLSSHDWHLLVMAVLWIAVLCNKITIYLCSCNPLPPGSTSGKFWKWKQMELVSHTGGSS